MKLTKPLRQIIVRQFKGGDSMTYLASLYGFSVDRVEAVIRDWMIAQEAAGKV